MSLLLVGAVVLAGLNLARMAATGEGDPFSIGLQVFVIVVGGIFLLTDSRATR
jgi:hypothetical protein